MLAGLLVVLEVHLVPALLAGLLVHELVHAIAPRITFAAFGASPARLFTVGLLGALVIGGLIAVSFGILAFFRAEGGPAALVIRLADILDASRASLPAWLAELLPPDAEALQAAMVEWLRANARELQLYGRNVLEVLVRMLIGMVIGAIVCFRQAAGGPMPSLLMDEASARIHTLAASFRNVVFAQVKISALNTVLTGIFLAGVLPMLGVHLPFTKSLIALTFVAGLIPILGNLISNTVIFVVGLSISLSVALGALVYLIIIHKLEYFLNARIIGGQIRASAWELLCAMLVFEAAYGLPGLVAAPIFYSYAKAELRKLAWL